MCLCCKHYSLNLRLYQGEKNREKRNKKEKEKRERERAKKQEEIQRGII